MMGERRLELTEALAWLASISVAGEPTETAWKAVLTLLQFPTDEHVKASGTALLESGYPAWKKVSEVDRRAILIAALRITIEEET